MSLKIRRLKINTFLIYPKHQFVQIVHELIMVCLIDQQVLFAFQIFLFVHLARKSHVDNLNHRDQLQHILVLGQWPQNQTNYLVLLLLILNHVDEFLNNIRMSKVI